MTSQADLVAVLTARDRMSPVFRKVGQDIEKTRKGFDGFAATIARFGIPALTIGGTIKVLSDSLTNVSKSLGATQFILEAFGPEAVAAFDKARPSMKAFAELMNVAESDVVKAYGILVREGGRVNPSFKQLKFAFDLARSSGLRFEDTANIVGQSLSGNYAPLMALTGPGGFKSLEQVMQAAAKGAGTSTTMIDKFTGGLKQLGEEVVTDPLGVLKDSFKETGSVIADLGAVFQSTVKGMDKTLGEFVGGPSVKGLLDLSTGLKVFGSTPWVITVKTAGDAWERGMPGWWLQVEKASDKAQVIQIDAAGSFFTQASPKYWLDVIKGVEAPPVVTISALGTFFTRQPAKYWLDVIKGVENPPVVNISATGTFFTKGTPDWLQKIYQILPGGLQVTAAPGNVKGFQHGGVVTKPTLAMIGEAGPEAVMPLGKGNGAGTGGKSVIVNMSFTGDLIVDNETRQRDMVREIATLLTENIRRGLAL